MKISTLKLFEYFWNYNLKEREDSDYYEYDENEEEEEKIENVRASKEIITEALDCWLFLITSIGNASDIGSLLDTYCHSLLSLIRLESTGVTEKIHIGKAL